MLTSDPATVVRPFQRSLVMARCSGFAVVAEGKCSEIYREGDQHVIKRSRVFEFDRLDDR